jgi:hypothetical protein
MMPTAGALPRLTTRHRPHHRDGALLILSGRAWSRTGQDRQEVEVSDSDLVEIAKRNGDFRKNYGVVLGACLYLCSVNAAAGRRPFLWGALLSLGIGIAGLILKYGLPFRV